MRRVVAVADLPVTRWRNGGGATREIEACGDEHGVCWRASVAEVAQDGPFSDFSGLRRVLILLTGVGMRLEFPGTSVQLGAGDVVRFAGHTPCNAWLADGPTTDFNWFVGDSWRGDATWAEPGVAQRSTRVVLAPDAASLRVDGAVVDLAPGTCLVARSGADVNVLVGRVILAWASPEGGEQEPSQGG